MQANLCIHVCQLQQSLINLYFLKVGDTSMNVGKLTLVIKKLQSWSLTLNPIQLIAGQLRLEDD